MDRSSKKTARFFKECGRIGGLKRARRLSVSERTTIAVGAARARWKKGRGALPPLLSVRLEKPNLADPVFMEELFTEGSLAQWGQIYREIADCPYGAAAGALEKVLISTEVYGVTPLWRGILRTVRGA